MRQSQQQQDLLLKLQSHEGILYKITKSYCPNENDRQDLFQEMLYHLFKAYPKYNPELKFTTWMYRVCLNVAISNYRKSNARPPHSDFSNMEEMSDYGIDQQNEKELRLKLLDQFINELKPIDKALMVLYLEEKPYREIAEIMGITESNAGTKINRIKIKLEEKFSSLK